MAEIVDRRAGAGSGPPETRRLTRDELLAALAEAQRTEETDTEKAHRDADTALIDYIADPDIRDAYSAIYKWYA